MSDEARDTAVAAMGIAPAKAILFGEHAVNRGEPALAVSVGLHARCMVAPVARPELGFRFRSGEHDRSASRDELLGLARQVDAWRAAGAHDAIRRAGAADYFAAAKYVMASAFGADLPAGLDVAWFSEIPPSSGLGSGGAAFVALVSALAHFLPRRPSVAERAELAHRGDVVAHGGIASGLDTQMSLLGGVIRYTGEGLAEPVPCAGGLTAVIGHTGVTGATGDVNARVRRWLAERPEARAAYFRAVGALSRAAVPCLRDGNWDELGRLMNLNQLVLEKIGVSSPRADALIEAALGAGAYGAKVSGSGGGGIILALVSLGTMSQVCDAIRAAGGTALTPDVAVPGAV